VSGQSRRTGTNVSLRVPGRGGRCTHGRPVRCAGHSVSAVVRSGWTEPCWRASCRRSRAPWWPCTRPCTPIIPTSAASANTHSPVRHPYRGGPAVRLGAGWKPGDVRPGRRPVPGTDRAVARGGGKASGPRSPLECPRCCWPTIGVLVFHRTPELAILVVRIVEEAAQAASSRPAGRPVEIPAELRAAALQRTMAFDNRGTLHG